MPRLSYASVEGIFVELVGASPVRRAANDVKYRSESPSSDQSLAAVLLNGSNGNLLSGALQ